MLGGRLAGPAIVGWLDELDTWKLYTLVIDKYTLVHTPALAGAGRRVLDEDTNPITTL